MASASKELIYLAGSMRNRAGILSVAKALEAAHFRVFHSWINPGPETDDQWMEWQKALGRDYFEAMDDPHVRNVYSFDLEWLRRCDGLVMVGPAGRSAHGELGYMFGKGKPTFVLMQSEPDRWDIMTGAFTDYICGTTEDLLAHLNGVFGHDPS